MKKYLLLTVVLLAAGSLYAQVTLLSNNTNLQNGLVVNNKLFLLQDKDSIWTSDGTPAGTTKLPVNFKWADSGFAYNSNFTRLYFTGVTTPEGAEPWSTDATEAGSAMIRDINPGAASSGARGWYNFNGQYYFVANNGVNGNELWKTDGTYSGTVMVTDINPGAADAFPEYPMFIEHNNWLYFIATNGTSGLELWKTDGTSVGTSLVSDITPGTSSTDFFSWGVLGNTLVFTVTVPFTLNQQVWKTDGTAAGTSLLKDFGPMTAIVPSELYLFNNKLFIMITPASGSAALWNTDATVAGTVMVKEIDPGGTGGFTYFSPVAIGGKFYFTATTAAAGTELWWSDGTTSGTSLFKDINPGVGSSNAYILPHYAFYGNGNTLYNGKLFVNADDGTIGTELWITDGTVAGTVLVKDINPAGDGFFYSAYMYTSIGMYFAADDGAGLEPWRSDGTTAGTAMQANLSPLPAGSDPYFIIIYNNQLYFTADNGDNTEGNRDLYKFNATLSVLPVTLLSFEATAVKEGAALSWITSAEQHTDRFQVQRSSNGADFQTIGTVKAAGESTSKKEYRFTDADALKLQQPVLYYRLEVIDQNGARSYSNIEKLAFNASVPVLSLRPNPVNDRLWITASGLSGSTAQVEVIDAAGSIQLQYRIHVNTAGYAQEVMDVSRLAKGSYVLKLTSGDLVQVQQFIK